MIQYGDIKFEVGKERFDATVRYVEPKSGKGPGEYVVETRSRISRFLNFSEADVCLCVYNPNSFVAISDSEALVNDLLNGKLHVVDEIIGSFTNTFASDEVPSGAMLGFERYRSFTHKLIDVFVTCDESRILLDTRTSSDVQLSINDIKSSRISNNVTRITYTEEKLRIIRNLIESSHESIQKVINAPKPGFFSNSDEDDEEEWDIENDIGFDIESHDDPITYDPIKEFISFIDDIAIELDMSKMTPKGSEYLRWEVKLNNGADIAVFTTRSPYDLDPTDARAHIMFTLVVTQGRRMHRRRFFVRPFVESIVERFSQQILEQITRLIEMNVHELNQTIPWESCEPWDKVLKAWHDNLGSSMVRLKPVVDVAISTFEEDLAHIKADLRVSELGIFLSDIAQRPSWNGWHVQKKSYRRGKKVTHQYILNRAEGDGR